MTTVTWLKSSAIGILFAIFPAWWSCTAIVIKAVTREHKVVPQWLSLSLLPNPYTDAYFFGILPKKFYLVFFRVAPFIWIALILIVYHYIARNDYLRVNLVDIILIETSFPVFLLITWLLPVFFLRRYLQKLPTEEKD